MSVLTILDDCDKRIARQLRGAGTHKRVTCGGPGCNGCCRQWIGVTYLEAEHAVREAERCGVDMAALAERARASAARALAAPVARERWYGTPCVFLGEDGACMVYEARPVTCRLHMVVSDPALCMDLEPRTVAKVNTKASAYKALVGLSREHAARGVVVRVAEISVMVDLALRGGDPADLPGDDIGVCLLEEGDDGAIEPQRLSVDRGRETGQSV